MLSKNKKTKIIAKAQIHDKDTGSPDVQVAVITERIDYLADHLKIHKKDNHTRKGLLKLVSKRQAHMKYLQRKSPERYAAALSTVKSK
ncbi:MAG: ribosomal protein [Candidatus Parcubacteria bacterium]|jgi:small subunit ribosomal protein S15